MVPTDPRVDLCDDRHQAIAFVGTCPICSRRAGNGLLAIGRATFRGELDRLLAEHYADKEAGVSR